MLDSQLRQVLLSYKADVEALEQRIIEALRHTRPGSVDLNIVAVAVDSARVKADTLAANLKRLEDSIIDRIEADASKEK